MGANMEMGKGKVFKIIFIVLIIVITLYLLIQFIRCRIEVKKSYQRLKTYNAKTTSLSYGKMTYIDQGKREAILVVHGIFGGI